MKQNKTPILITFLILFELLFYIVSNLINISSIIIPVILILLGLTIILYKKNNKNKQVIYIFLLILGMIFRNIYVMHTGLYDRSYDILGIYENGHLAYIYHLYAYNILPVAHEWQFYHPPLFHLIAALFLKFNDLLGFSLETGYEGIQYLNVLFSTFNILICYKIINKIKEIKDNYFIYILLNFFPIFFLFSGSINNDCLVTMLETLVVYLLIVWYENTNLKNTIFLALTTGLCVMTKASGAIMAVPILYVFLQKLLTKKEITKNILKMFLFGIISLPIGLWYQIRCMIKFGSISIPTPANWLSVANHTLFERFIDLPFSQIFDKIFCNVTENDYNMFSFLVKSSIFEEFKYYNVSKYICYLFLLLNIILIVFSIISLIKYLKNKNKKNITLNILFISWLSLFISYIIFNIKYPYYCSYDFRYIVLCSLASIIIMFYEIKNKKILNIIISMFSFISIIFYTYLIFK